MATVTEFVILATGWKYQQVVCLPQGMGVTFFGIGPIGATILAVELLKLPLAIWTASRRGWQKGFMLIVGLPMICLLTFQLVKDMAVYEMGVAMTPAAQNLEKAMAQENRVIALNGELAAIEQKKADRQNKLDELAGREAKAKADLAEALKHNDDSRTDAISLTDYQKKELADVESREAAITAQANADTAELNKELADLRARRETELGRASQWNAEDARLDNNYKAKLVAHENAKSQYEKDKAAWDKATVLQRPFMKKPVDPGVPPVREDNPILKPATLAQIDDEIKAKEAELLSVNNKRRDRVGQVEAEAHQLREEFDQRSTARRQEADRKRDDLLAGQAALETGWKAEQKQIDDELAGAVQRVDGIHAELDDARKQAEEYYEAREAAIRKTQVHRIATTVEIVRGWIKGEKPATIKATAKERGDILTDQISMVRIWVYPVLAFIVAFLPTLMVEIGFSTVFEPEKKRPAYRLGFLGRRVHWLYMRAGRQKILRAERVAGEAAEKVAAVGRALEETKTAGELALAHKEIELTGAREALIAATAEREARLKQQEAEHAEALKAKEDEWVAKLTTMADSLHRMTLEKDALRDLQKSEVERQIQLRQNAWSDRVTQLRQELDEQRAASEAERTGLMQTHQKKLLEVVEEGKTQLMQTRRQAADAEMAAMETTARLGHELKESRQARDLAESQLRQQNESFALKLSQAKEDGARELEKAVRQEKRRLERQQLEFAKSMRQSEEDFVHQLKQREQEMTLAFDARLADEQARTEQEARRREGELERRFEARSMEVDARWKQDAKQREEAAQARLDQREQQWQAQCEARIGELQTKAEQDLRRIESDWKRQVETQTREAASRLKQELQQKEIDFQTRLQQREQELAGNAEAREAELRSQASADLRAHEEEWARESEARVRAAETRWRQEAQQKDEATLAKARQRDQQWQTKLDGARAEWQTQREELARRHDVETDARLRELEVLLRKEMQQKDEAAQLAVRQREQELETEFFTKAEARRTALESQWEKESDRKVRAALEPLQAQVSRAEKERDEARQASIESSRRVESLEKKLTEASVFLNGWRSGNGNGHHVTVA